MNRTTLRYLAIAVAALALLLLFMESGDDATTDSAGGALIPDLVGAIENATRIEVARADLDNPLIIKKAEDTWVVEQAHGYAASIATVRGVLLGIVEAQIVEAKTANSDLHHHLGLRDPDVDGSKATLVKVSGEGLDEALIIGNLARTDMRYVRRTGEAQSYLVDRDIDVPGDANGWLDTNIIDISNTDIASVSIEHADGDTISLRKKEEEPGQFDVLDVPADRELSYETVANGVAGALNGLLFEDVRPAETDTPQVSTTFTANDGLVVTVSAFIDGDDKWTTITADAGDAADESAVQRASEINARVDGWQYRLQDYKLNLMTRTWDDILKPLEDD